MNAWNFSITNDQNNKSNKRYYKKNKFNKNFLNNESITVVCIDYGAKKNIFRSLVERNLNLIILNYY